ncbi:MAG: cytochrome c [Boseongicola sp.]|nr:cytochrome c [Boseongicola sp.]MDD9978609.1 cytochrome c [Boseongicola sp.]
MPGRMDFFAVVSAMTLSTFPVGAQDVGNGSELAKEHCLRCHDISVDGKMKTMPPSFASIAVFRDYDQIRMRIMFPAMHSIMPAWSQMFSNTEVDDLAAYIVSLE